MLQVDIEIFRAWLAAKPPEEKPCPVRCPLAMFLTQRMPDFHFVVLTHITIISRASKMTIVRQNPNWAVRFIRAVGNWRSRTAAELLEILDDSTQHTSA